jgi:hypothetical protein
MRASRHLVLGLIASALGFAALWLATESPTIEAPPGFGGTTSLEFTCIQAPWDVVVNNGAGLQAGGELPIDYSKTEIACDEAGRRQFTWAIGVALVGALTLLLAAAGLRDGHGRRE